VATELVRVEDRGLDEGLDLLVGDEVVFRQGF
jgi:hypothetical protein